MKSTMEHELKFEGNDEVDLARLGGEPLEPHTFSSTYYDTRDRRLLRARITLRRRVENGLGVWQLKLPHERARLEVEDVGGPTAPPSSIGAVLSGVLRGQAIEPIATLRTHRHGRRVDGVAVTMDEVEVLEGHEVVDRFTEIEAELVEGTREAVERVARRLEQLGARSTKGLTKLGRAIELPARTEPDPRAPVLHQVRAMLRAQYEELLRTDPVLRLAEDADAVHDMRVAVRRLRSLLRSTKPMLDREWVDGIRSELDWLAGRLGTIRDLDVLIEHFSLTAAELDGGDAAIASVLLRPLETERGRARDRLRAALEKPRYHELLDALESASRVLPARRADVTLRKLARKEYRKLKRRARGFPDLNDMGLHRMRIQGKRARYAAELAAASEGKRVARFVDAARDLQDALGTHQDAVVAVRRLRELARLADRSDAALVAGRLIEREGERKRDARAEAAAAWKGVRRAGTKAW